MSNKKKIDWLDDLSKYDRVSVSDFSRGQASKVFREIQEGEKVNYTVLKNNKIIANILSRERYESYVQDSQIVDFLYDLAKIEGRAYSAAQLIKNIDNWRDGFYSMQDFMRFDYDNLDEYHRQIVDRVIASEEYAEPIKKNESDKATKEDIRKAIEENIEDIKAAAEKNFKEFLNERLEEIIEKKLEEILEDDR